MLSSTVSDHDLKIHDESRNLVVKSSLIPLLTVWREHDVIHVSVTNTYELDARDRFVTQKSRKTN
jgi:hypothetical protein